MKHLMMGFLIAIAAVPLRAGEADGRAAARAEAKFDRYELSVLYDATGYFTLSVFEKTPGGYETETVYGLRKAEMYMPKDYKAGSWMVFFGDQPPAYMEHGTPRVLKDPWLLSVKNNVWRAARVKHFTGKNDLYQLLRVQSAKDGSPELVYLSGDGEEDHLSPDGWAADSKITIAPKNLVPVSKIRLIRSQSGDIIPVEGPGLRNPVT